MERKILIKELRIYFENRVTTKKELSVIVSIDQNITKIVQLAFNPFCTRWESHEQIELTSIATQEIHFQICKVKGSPLKKIVGLGKIELQCLPAAVNEQLKVCLKSNGQVVGWLYCQFIKGQQAEQPKQHFLNMHRLMTSFLDMRDEDCNISIYLNNSLIFIKDIRLKLRKRTLFPIIKQKVKKSDVLVFQIRSNRQRSRNIMFLIDKLQSGQTAVIQTWIRNKIGNKMGDLQLQYFLQNFFLPNKVPKFSAVQTVKKVKKLRIQQQLTVKQRQELRVSVSIQALNQLGQTKSQKQNGLLKKIIQGERRRKNLVYCPLTTCSTNNNAQMDQIIEDTTIVQI